MTTTLRLLDGRPERLLVVVAHPDDADYAMAGSVARWTAAGSVAQLVCCTSGDATGDDAGADPLEVAARREREQRAAAALVGYEAVVFLHRPEGALVNDLALREQLVRIARTFRPDALAAPDPRTFILPWGRFNHVDHREAGAAAADLVEAAGNALAFPGLVRSEGLAPHAIPRTYLFWSEQADVAVDISGALQTKVHAIEAHASRRDRSGDVEEQVRAWARGSGAPLGLDAAETFVLVESGPGAP